MKMRSKKLSGINNSETQNKSRDKSKDKNEEKFKLLYNKFLEDEKKKQKSIERMKEKKEEEEKKLYVFQPIINKKSKELTAKSKENQKDFYIRQKELLEQYKKNEELLREKIMKEKDDKIKNSIFPKKIINNRYKNNDLYRNIKSRLFDWEEKQKNIIKNSNKEDFSDKEESDSKNNKIEYKIRVNRNINRISHK